MIDKIRDMVLELCKDRKWDWKSHVESVVKYSKILAKKLGADEEICEISAWLHDIVKIEDMNTSNHHIKGSEEAANILKKFNYPNGRIEKVKHCILTHSSDKNHSPESKEAKILAAADALSHFDNFVAQAYATYNLDSSSIEQGREYLVNKYQACWNKLEMLQEAKEIAGPKYEAIKLILGE